MVMTDRKTGTILGILCPIVLVPSDLCSRVLKGSHKTIVVAVSYQSICCACVQWDWRAVGVWCWRGAPSLLVGRWGRQVPACWCLQTWFVKIISFLCLSVFFKNILIDIFHIIFLCNIYFTPNGVLCADVALKIWGSTSVLVLAGDTCYPVLWSEVKYFKKLSPTHFQCITWMSIVDGAYNICWWLYTLSSQTHTWIEQFVNGVFCCIQQWVQ